MAGRRDERKGIWREEDLEVQEGWKIEGKDNITHFCMYTRSVPAFINTAENKETGK